MRSRNPWQPLPAEKVYPPAGIPTRDLLIRKSKLVRGFAAAGGLPPVRLPRHWSPTSLARKYRAISLDLGVEPAAFVSHAPEARSESIRNPKVALRFA